MLLNLKLFLVCEFLYLFFFLFQDIFVSLSQVDGMYFVCNIDDFKFLADMIQHIPLNLRSRYVFCTAPINKKQPFVCTSFLKVRVKAAQGREVMSFYSSRCITVNDCILQLIDFTGFMEFYVGVFCLFLNQIMLEEFYKLKIIVLSSYRIVWWAFLTVSLIL